MKIEKKVLANLNKCYSIAPLMYQGKRHILVAAEKQDPCYLFDEYGNKVDTVWEQPGGTMSMVQIPNTDGQFLATHKFYSPNDSKEAKIVIVTPKEKGNWEVRTLVDLPHVHRFDIVQGNGNYYLIACTLKSGHEYKEDWTSKGKIYVANLPKDFSQFSDDNQLEMTVIKDNLLKNHGYYKVEDQGVETCVISSEDGVFQVTPPEKEDGEWKICQLLDCPASDGVLVDLDQDGEKELVTIAPFHGETIRIYKKVNGTYEEIYQYEKPATFAHSLYGGTLNGKPAVVIGHRQGERNIILFTYNMETKSYEYSYIDEDCGSANVLKYELDGKEVLISTNREIDEIAMYTFS